MLILKFIDLLFYFSENTPTLVSVSALAPAANPKSIREYDTVSG